MLTKNRCYIALGSNLDNPSKQVLTAIDEIANIAHTNLLAASGLYKTSPVGPIKQDDFINAVIEVETSLSSQVLFDQLCQIEKQHQRIRNERWGPRTLDCDMLMFGDLIQQTAELTLPHPRMIERLFVLIPLQEIAENLLLPNGKLISEQVNQLQSLMSGDFSVERMTNLEARN